MLSKLFKHTPFIFSRMGMSSLVNSRNSYSFSTEIKAEKTSYGGLKDQDRIFTNLYRDQDPLLKGALKRVCNYICLLCIDDLYRAIGIRRKTLYQMVMIGL